VDHGFDVDAIARGKPSNATIMRRGFLKRCPRCGGGHLYEGWFRMRDRCPSCGYLFEREPGFFVGAYLINFAIAEGFLFVLLMGFMLWKNAHPETGLVVPIAVGVAIGIVAPIVFYPFARTIWSAIDLAMTPLELPEIVAAADALEAGRVEGDGPVDGPIDPSGAPAGRPDD
jgi:uncharacterized protein (DUF983 family)